MRARRHTAAGLAAAVLLGLVIVAAASAAVAAAVTGGASAARAAAVAAGASASAAVSDPASAAGGASGAARSSGAAFAPLWSQPVTSAARLVVGDGATAVWAAQGTASGAAILARHYDGSGQAAGAGPAVLVDGIAGLNDWLAAPGRGSDVLLAWKAGGAVLIAGRTAAGASVFGPVTACTDALVAQARGAGAAATPVALHADGRGGAYLLLSVTPSSPSGDSLLAHVSATGELAAPDPGAAVAKGTAALAAADDEGHLCVVLTGPGRTGVALQRYSPELTADWAQPVGPYNPLAGPPSAAVQTPLGVGASSVSWMAWREDDSVLTQRFGKAGDRLWLRPVAVKAAVGALVAGDGAGGVYVASASGTKLSTAHILYDGSAGGAPAASSFETGSPGLRLDAASSDESGDLDIAFSSGAGGNGRVAEMTCLGAWTAPALSPPAAPFAALADDGSGGAYALDQGDGARLWRLGAPGAALTLRPRAAALAYGDTLEVSGYLTLDGTPLDGVAVQLTPSTGTAPAVTLTNAGGYYATWFKPDASASWTAAAQAPGGATVTSAAVTVTVAPKVSLTLSTRRSGAGYVTIFSGEVDPAHRGNTVIVQRQQGAAWRPLKTAKLDASSAYKASWKVPLKTATYVFRTVLPAHGDHAEGVSRPVRLKVVVRPR